MNFNRNAVKKLRRRVEVKKKEVRPQPGFQEDFLSSSADIVIGGGAAGAGKTFAELMEAMRHIDVPGFSTVFFRRTKTQIRNKGGLWDESHNLYPAAGAVSNSQQLEWTFPKGGVVKFSHLEHEKDIYTHQGGQYPLIIFDELTHFSEKMFFYLLSRNRSTCGVRPYVRATCNPDPDSFILKLIWWWIDTEEKNEDGSPNSNYGFPIKERSGVVRYFARDNNEYIWGSTRQEVIDKIPHILENVDEEDRPNYVKSITFIPGSIYANKELLKKDPGYLANLNAQDAEDKARLLYGNWMVVTNEDCIFHFTHVNNMFSNFYPSNIEKKYITCDAARLGNDWTVIVVWHGWKVIKIVVLKKSEDTEVVNAIEHERKVNLIPKSNVVIDQDGVGGGVVRKGSYKGFSGGTPALEEPGTYIKENYENLKTQCYYRFSERVNNDEVSMILSDQNVQVDGVFTVKTKVNGKVEDVRVLIKADLRAIRRRKKKAEEKHKINTKEEQKALLQGRSPDFGDALMMRSWFDLTGSMLAVSAGRTSYLDYV